MIARQEPSPGRPKERALAPLPDHRNVFDPSWQRAWARFGHVTTPLRERGLSCDVQYGLDDWIVYAWLPGHDSVVLVGRQNGWLATHQTPAESPTSMSVLYDTTVSPGPDDFADVEPLLSAVDALLARLARAQSPPAAHGVHVAEVPAPPAAGRGTRSR